MNPETYNAYVLSDTNTLAFEGTQSNRYHHAPAFVRLFVMILYSAACGYDIYIL
jgi:hypothetical protein